MSEQSKHGNEEIWKEYFAKRFYLATPEEKITSIALLNAFKQALKDRIKSRIELSSDSAKMAGYFDILDLIEKVNPL